MHQLRNSQQLLSVIIPVHNGGYRFIRCLEALRNSTCFSYEIIIVDDASTDASLDIGSRFGAQAIALKGSPQGPAAARNRGAEAASGENLLFLDSDVLVHPKTLEKIVEILAARPEVDALFGSYDDDPPHRGMVSRYKNLQHHYIHHHSQREATTFWAGCGAIRKNVFVRLGGFDESYRRPSVEDIELGLRMVQAGCRIWLCPEVQVTHLKKWTFLTWLQSDIRDRAVPWTRLIALTSHIPSDLNLNLKSRMSALAAWTLVVSFIVGFWVPLARSGILLWMGVIGILNFGLYRFFLKKGGILFAIFSFGLHTFYYLYSSLTFGVLFAWYRLIDRTRARPKTLLTWTKRISE